MAGSSLRLPPKKLLLEADINTSEAAVALWAKASDWYFKNYKRTFPLYKWEKQIKEVVPLLAHGADNTPLRINALLLAGDIMYIQRKYSRALNYYETALADLAEPMAAHFKFFSKNLADQTRLPISLPTVRGKINEARASMLWRTKDYPATAQAAATGLQDNPQSVRLHILNVAAHMQAEQFQASLFASENLLKLCETNLKILNSRDEQILYFSRAYCLNKLGDKSRAHDEMSMVLKTRPRNLKELCFRPILHLYRFGLSGEKKAGSGRQL